jgi:hypothetical protein
MRHWPHAGISIEAADRHHYVAASHCNARHRATAPAAECHPEALSLGMLVVDDKLRAAYPVEILQPAEQVGAVGRTTRFPAAAAVTLVHGNRIGQLVGHFTAETAAGDAPRRGRANWKIR